MPPNDMMTDEELQEERGMRAPAPLNPFGSVQPAAAANASVAIGQAREVADVQAAMLVAQRFPRDQIAAMDRILMAFTRPTLAETALYEYSRGGSEVTGLSIRAAEAMAQQWGHIHMGVEELEQRPGESTVRAFAFDAQTGTRDSRVFQVKHWRDTKRGGYKLEDQRDIYELIANVAARRKRACVLTVIPGDVQEAVKRQVEMTLKARVEITPELLKSLEAKFAEFGVPVAAIEKRIQRRMEAITPGLVVQLGKIYNSLKDGMSQAVEWFEIDAGAIGTAGVAQSKSGADALKAAANAASTAKKDAPEGATGQDAEKKPAAESGAAAADAKPAATEPVSPGGAAPAVQPTTGDKGKPSKADVATFASVAAKIAKADSIDALNLARDLVRSVENEQHRRELNLQAADKEKVLRGDDGK